MTRYWMGVACARHARAGRDGGFAQLGHGKQSAISGLQKGDWIIYYSPREEIDGGVPVQAFTTIGQITSEKPYQADQSMGFHPHRVDVDYLLAATPAPIRPLLEELELTQGRAAYWGFVMRGAKRKLSEADFQKIALAMGVTI
ncbi:EVE domain-containing protein [Thalassospira sp. MCCC 1A01428]|uniref:EVE domain-containing protein n=1 Tax=Thalassospira sp. MCCC 1A01428 TaxID=1470575 RepID=UPI000A231B01|nr:EVE domain-containing protein [Thalassospira sp. MCCC 1A01428]OSQ44166.1 hypothetical protein THS27_08160 [Thalassospira sp. MCCC 1A01428]